MISSRPQMATATSRPLDSPFGSARLMASTTAVGFLMAPSTMTSGASGAIPRDVRRKVRPEGLSWTALMALEPMSSPSISGVLRSSPANGFFMYLNSMGGAHRPTNIFHLPWPVAGPSYPSKGSYVEPPFDLYRASRSGLLVPVRHDFSPLTNCKF